jgi:hypothetical protein
LRMDLNHSRICVTRSRIGCTNNKTKRDMRTWKVTIKEKLMNRPIETTYTGDVDYEFVKKWFGCDQPDVEWYKIEEVK